ncbi:HD domain-containing protein [Halomicrobium sp. LC1Hm]|uniref:HD domain-containing protein n=1 Tax=Halomicrobium sp. LC1Hm TaxID=2610902 RepID=UPI0012984F3C|nr:HD domain-containing protein [Halomicrobium sp. LC1Hm]QGA81431.1 putative HD superfamily hydrolase [Halomicrobium sp. LC1Hm]
MPSTLDSLARSLAMPYYDAALPAHDRFHAKRVRDLSLRLAERWDRAVDRDVLSGAAWLHDIGRPLERVGEIDDHGEWATVTARELLAEEGVAASRIDAVAHCLRTHSIRSSSPEPESPEAKLLFDADKLDATGAVGIVRLACVVGERSGRTGTQYAHLDDASTHEATTDRRDISVLREWARERLARLHTPPARRLGRSRWRFMEAFFEQFESEIGVRADA